MSRKSDKLTWTPQRFKAARRKLKLSTRGLALIMNTDPVTVRRWEMVGTASARRPDPQACRMLEWFLLGFRPPEWEVAKSLRAGRPKKKAVPVRQTKNRKKSDGR